MAKGSRKGEPPKIVYDVVKYDDKEYQLAILGKGRDVPDGEKIKIAEVVCVMYSSNKWTLDSCLKKCGLRSRVTWFNWCDQIKQIELLYQNAQKMKSRIYRTGLQELGRTMAEKLMTGFEKTVMEREGNAILDAEGKIIGISTEKVREKVVYVRPSAAVILKVLYNMDARNFEQNPKPVEKINKDIDINIDPIKWVE